MDIEYSRPDEQEPQNACQNQGGLFQQHSTNSMQPGNLFQQSGPQITQNFAPMPMTGLFAMPAQNYNQFSGGQQFGFFGNQGALNTQPTGQYFASGQDCEEEEQDTIKPSDLVSDDDQAYESSEDEGEEESSGEEEGMAEMVEDEARKIRFTQLL